MVRSISIILVIILEQCIAIAATGLHPKNKVSEREKELKIDLNLPPPEDDIAHIQSSECEMHNPGCIHWKSIPSDEKGKLYYRWIRKIQTKEQREAYKESSRIRNRKRYDEFSEEEKIAYRLKNSQSRKRKLENMNEEERKKWYKKNNSYYKKPSKEVLKNPK